MNLVETQKILDNNKEIIGTMYKERKVDALVIVPKKAKKLNLEIFEEIVTRVYWKKPYDDLLAGYKEFAIVALLNLKNYTDNGTVPWTNLDYILKTKLEA